MKPTVCVIALLCLVSLAIPGCGPLEQTGRSQATPILAISPSARETGASPTSPTPGIQYPTEDEHQTLASLEMVDDFPLYIMTYTGDYLEVSEQMYSRQHENAAAGHPAWGCSLFSAFGDPGKPIYGRNFDWSYSPALLLFTHPSDGYASVSMVDLAYLVDEPDVRRLTDLPLEWRGALLAAPWLPFDGMNAAGVAIGMAAVPAEVLPLDPDKETLDSLMVIREVLDHAGDVNQAVAILQSYNIDWGSGPPLHYLVADRSGRAVLLEHSRGEVALIRNQDPWHLATNFIVDQAGEQPERMCPRYRRIQKRLLETNGLLTAPEGMQLLSEVAQGNSGSGTQWSVVYGITTGEVHVVMDRQYDTVYSFFLAGQR